MRFGTKSGYLWLVHSEGTHSDLLCIFIITVDVRVQLLLQIAGKQAGYRAMSEYYQSLVCKSNKIIGEEIARLEVKWRYQHSSIVT